MNAGSIISVADEYLRKSKADAEVPVDQIGDRLNCVLDPEEEQHVSSVVYEDRVE